MNKEASTTKDHSQKNDETLIIQPDDFQKQAATLPPALAERYVIRDRIGEGGFGVVYLADDLEIGRPVAIKLLFTKWTGNEQVDARFVQEARIAGQLEHPNIVIVYDLHRALEASCIIMEYVRDGSLRHRLQRDRTFSLAACLPIIIDMLHGLRAAHESGVVHRDIKPSNVLFGVRGEAKLTDFGIAHLPVNRGGLLDDEDRHNRLGSPFYVPPEQWLGDGVDPRSDLYAVGAVMYEMLSGHRAHKIPDNATPMATSRALRGHKPTPLAEYCPELPTAVCDLVMRLLSTNPTDRQHDAAGVIADLEAIGASDPNHVCAVREAEIHLTDVVRLLLIDGVMTEAERVELNRRATATGVPRGRVHELINKVCLEMGLPAVHADVASATDVSTDEELDAARTRVQDLIEESTRDSDSAK